MKFLLTIFSLISIFPFLASEVHAIIFLPALVLIPIAKIVAVIIAGLSIPVLGIGGILGKAIKGSATKGILVAIGVLTFAAVVLFFVLKFVSPEHPLI